MRPVPRLDYRATVWLWFKAILPALTFDLTRSRLIVWLWFKAILPTLTLVFILMMIPPFFPNLIGSLFLPSLWKHFGKNIHGRFSRRCYSMSLRVAELVTLRPVRVVCLRLRGKAVRITVNPFRIGPCLQTDAAPYPTSILGEFAAFLPIARSLTGGQIRVVQSVPVGDCAS